MFLVIEIFGGADMIPICPILQMPFARESLNTKSSEAEYPIPAHLPGSFCRLNPGCSLEIGTWNFCACGHFMPQTSARIKIEIAANN
jgi:hypothetical protein